MKTEKKHQTTEEIISRIRAGEQAAFGQLIKAYEPLVHAGSHGGSRP